MSLSDVVVGDALQRLSALKLEDFTVIASATSLGYKPEGLFQAVRSLKDGQAVELPRGGGQPKPLTINAWSFVNDREQYHGTYLLPSTRAIEIKELLLKDREAAKAAILEVVSARIAARGSNKEPRVSFDGMPGSAGGADNTARVTHVGADLCEEIKKDSARYGQYKFKPEDTDRTGSLRFKVPLGMGLYATYQNKRGAVNVARIVRVKGRFDELVVEHVHFWMPGKPWLSGSDIPEKVTFDGKLAPSQQAPANPVPSAKTESPSSA